jgi:hypothetical protein
MYNTDKLWWLLCAIVAVFICLWITIGALNSILDNTRHSPDKFESAHQQCIDQGGVPIYDGHKMEDCKRLGD